MPRDGNSGPPAVSIREIEEGVYCLPRKCGSRLAAAGRGKAEVDDDEMRLVYSGADYLGFEVVVYIWNGDFSETDGVMREEGQAATPVGRLSVPAQEVVFREVYEAGGSLKFGRLNSSNFDSVGGEII